MAKSFHTCFEDLKAGRDVRAAQEALYGLAWSALLEPLRGRIPAKARRRLDAEDVLHEAILRALKGVAEAECASERQFLAWVYTIARNLMTDQARRMSAAAVPFAQGKSVEDDAGQPRASRVAARDGTPESGLVRREAIDAILSAMREGEADIIRRRWLSGQSIAEIASALRKTPKAVEGLYTRAWKRFRQIARRAEKGEGP